MTTDNVTYMGRTVVAALNDLRGIWKRDLPVELTFIARVPNQPEQDVLITNDSLEGIIELIERSKGCNPR